MLTFFKLPEKLRESAPVKSDYVCEHLFWALVEENEDNVVDFMGLYGGFDVTLPRSENVNAILCQDCSEDYEEEGDREIQIKPTPDLRPPKLFSEEEMKRMWGHVKVQSLPVKEKSPATFQQTVPLDMPPPKKR